MSVTQLPARGKPVDFTATARNITSAFLAGYTAGIRWLETGAPEREADRLADFYEETRPGQQFEEATRYLDADDFLGLLASMHAQGHAERFQVASGDEVQAEFVRDYGNRFANWGLPSRVFAMTALDSFDEGLITAIWQATRS